MDLEELSVINFANGVKKGRSAKEKDIIRLLKKENTEFAYRFYDWVWDFFTAISHDREKVEEFITGVLKNKRQILIEKIKMLEKEKEYCPECGSVLKDIECASCDY